jgi:predicted ATPase
MHTVTNHMAQELMVLDVAPPPEEIKRRVAAVAAGRWRRPVVVLGIDGAYGQVGAVNEGLQVLAEALAAARKTGESVWEAELHRLKGGLVLQAQHQPPALESGMLHATDRTLHTAEACLHQALTIARRQQAKSLELRAAMSLARL